MATQYTRKDLCVGSWDLSADGCAGKDAELMDNYVAETIEIAGAKINIFKLLGVHEQGRLVDLTGSGNAISSATYAGYLPIDAFNNTVNTWRSALTGAAVLNTAFIGYNFGTKKTSYNTEQYAPSQPIRQHITRINIKQGALAVNRATRARIDRSEDGGLTWIRVDIVTLPDTANLETIDLKPSVASQMWRIVPIEFNGVTANEPWEVEEIELMDYEATTVTNIQDFFFNENRDKEYAKTSIQIKASYDVVESNTEFSRFGLDIPQQFVFQVSFAKMIEMLTRPLVIGDIIEVPSEMQYDTKLLGVKKYLEVTDTSWAANGYTPNWKPLIYRVVAEPLVATKKTENVIGMKKDYTNLNDDEFQLGDFAVSIGAKQADDFIRTQVQEDVPETGTDVSELETGTIDNDIPVVYHPTSAYVEDGIPPNGAPYTEGLAFPTTPADGDYHRLQYPTSTNIPTKLFRYNAIKNRWLYQETDMREVQSSHNRAIKRILSSSNKIDLD